MPKKAAPKKKISKKNPSKSRNPNINKSLAENFIALQKVMTNLAVKFDSLSIQISKLLELFEISAKTLAKKDIPFVAGKENPKVVEKLDTLLDQNKIIARSLTLLHEGGEQTAAPQQMNQPSPQRPPMMQQPSPVRQMNTNGYQKSMSAKNTESLNLHPER